MNVEHPEITSQICHRSDDDITYRENNAAQQESGSSPAAGAPETANKLRPRFGS
jgi:hypothetical protein